MAVTGDKLFRDAALKQLNSPDDLDRLVRVTGPIGWLAGVALALILVAVIGWSIVGRLPTRVPGTGLVLPQGGRIVEVQARGTGVLTRMMVNVGDRVEAGQMIGQIGETDAERELETARLQLADRQRDLMLAENDAEGEQRLRLESLRRQRASIDLRAQTARGREAELRDRLATTETLYRERLVTRAQLIGVQNELAATRQEISAAASDAARLGSEELELRRAAEERVRERRRAVDEVERRVASQAASLRDQLTLRSTISGSVVEVRTQPGALVRQGQAILALDQRGDGLEVVTFVNSQSGKRVRPGMEARIAVASARREEVGLLEGEVVSVSEFPLSFDGIRALIQNEDLARSFIQRGPPFMVRVRLRPDPNTVSGYRWTSRRGDGVAISSGVPATVEIVTELRRPIAMVIPALRELLSI